MGTEICEKPAKLLKAMGHPLRMGILKKIYHTDNCDQICLIHEFDVPQSTIAMHLGKLESYGLISCCHTNHHAYYKLSQDVVGRIIDVLEHEEQKGVDRDAKT